MGYGPLRRLVTVELPLAVPVIMAGLRVGVVSSISLASVGPLIGVSEGAPEPALAVPIVYRGDTVAALWFGAEPPPAVAGELDRVAGLLAPYCLVGWDTGGEEWVP